MRGNGWNGSTFKMFVDHEIDDTVSGMWRNLDYPSLRQWYAGRYDAARNAVYWATTEWLPDADEVIGWMREGRASLAQAHALATNDCNYGSDGSGGW